MAEEKLYVVIGAKTEGFLKGVDQMEKKLSKSTKNIQKFAKKAGMAMTAMGAAVVGSMVAMSKSWADAGTQIKDMSIRLGVGTEEISKLGYAAEQSGISFETFAMASQRMIRRVAEAAAGTGEAKDALIELGLTAKDLNNLTLEEKFNAITEAFGGVGNEADKVRLAMKLFDSEGVSLIQMMDGGVEGLKAFGDEASELGKVFSEEDAQAAKEFNDAITKLQGSLAGFVAVIAKSVVPALKTVVGGLTDAIKVVTNITGKFPGLNTVLGTITLAFGALMLALGPLLIVLPGLITMFAALGISVGAAAAAVWAFMAPILLVVAAIALIGIAIWQIIENWDSFKKMGELIWNGIADYFTGIWNTIVKIFKDNWEMILLVIFPAGGIIALFAKHWGPITAFFQKIWDKVRDSTIGAFARIKDAILSPIRIAVKAILEVVNFLIRSLNKLNISVPSWVPKIGGKELGFNIAEIDMPSFKKGGRVPGGRNDEMIARLHGGETVVPAGESAGSTLNLNVAELVVREEADIKRIARELYNMTIQKKRLAGVANAV